MLPPKHCNINLTGPIPRWDEAIPLGNGILGSLFWGPMEHLRISVDIAGLWLRRRPEEKLDKEFTYAKTGRACTERRCGRNTPYL